MSRSKVWIANLKKRLKSSGSAHYTRPRKSRRCLIQLLESREVLAASPIGSEFRVNTTVANQQVNSSLAMDSDGDYVVAWQSNIQDGSGYGVYAQRYNDAGEPQGSEFRVNTYTTNNQLFPSVAMDADGDFVVAWSSQGQDGDGYGVYAQRYNAMGVALGNEFRVNTHTTSVQGFPSVAMDVDGDFVVAWNGAFQDGDNNGVYAQRYNASGVVQGREFRVNTFTTGSQSNSSVAMDADGDFVVTWTSYGSQDGNNAGVYAQRYSAAGALRGGEFAVNMFTTEQQSSSSVAMDSDGDFVVAWNSFNQDGSLFGIYARRYDGSGLVQGNEFRVNTYTTNSQSTPSVAMDADGDFLVTWTSYYQDAQFSGIFAQRYNATGVTDGSEFRVNTFETHLQTGTSVAMDADGDFVVAWNSFSQDGSSYGVYAQRYNELTETAGPIVTEVRDLDRPIAPGGRLSTTLDSLTVFFSEDLSVADGASGANSVLNPANWQLTRDGVNISHLISGISFEQSVDSSKHEAELTLGAPLGTGTYRLSMLDTIRGLTGNALDGDANGTPGGSYHHSFAIETIENVQPLGTQVPVAADSTFINNQQSIAMDADGNYVVVFTGDARDGDMGGIFFRAFESDGRAVRTTDTPVNQINSGDQFSPDVAMDADGDFVVTWVSYNNLEVGLGDIKARRYGRDLAPIGNEFLVTTFFTPPQDAPAVAMDADGDFVITWQSSVQDGSFNGIYAQRYNAAGVAQGGEFRVNTVTTGSQFDPSVAMDADGDFVVTWTSYGQDGNSSGVYAQRYNAAGVSQGNEFRVNSTTAGAQETPSVSIDADGDFIIAWQTVGNGSSQPGIFAQRYSAAGALQGDEFRVNTTAHLFGATLSTAMDADGDFVVTWSPQLGVNRLDGVYAQRYSSGGVTQGPEITVFATPGSNETPYKSPSVAMDEDGDFVVAWEFHSPTDIELYLREYRSVDGPVKRDSAGVLTLTGTSFADTMSIERITPVGSPLGSNVFYMNVVHNGVNYPLYNSFEFPDVFNLLVMNGSTGDDRLVVAPSVNGTIFTRPVILNGDGGNDTLIAGSHGADRLNGGSGNDLYIFDTDTPLGSDILADTSGVDTIDYSGSQSLALVVNLSSNTNQVVNFNHSLRLASGNAIENIIGGAQGDNLFGNGRPNRITGGGGDDTLGGAGGNDTYLFDADMVLGADFINETGGGTDTLDFSATTDSNIAVDLSRIFMTQPVAAGRLSLFFGLATAIENVIGGSLNDTLTGNSLNNRFVGGLGDDNYVFRTNLVLGTDTIQDAGGIDTLNFASTTSRPITVDLSKAGPQVVTASQLTLSLSSGDSIENVIGGSLGDTLTGNALNNVLTGRGGDDSLNGGAGDDSYVFDSDTVLGIDSITDSSGIETLDFSSTTSRAINLDLSNTALQVVNDNLSLAVVSATSIENAIGGSLADTITGNSLDNQLTGGPGDDSLTGSAGNDTYVFAANSNIGIDTINESGGGIDTLDFRGTTTQSISVDLSNAAFQVASPTLSLSLLSGNTIENVIGGSQGDTLTGNALDNSLTGGPGNDTLSGGSGNDRYLFDTDVNQGADRINELSDGGTDTLDFSATTIRSVAVDLSRAEQSVTPARLTLILLPPNMIEDVVGGALADTLTGTPFDNSLNGGAGDDTLIGGAGNDSYLFDTDSPLGTDTINESGGGIDTLNFTQTTTAGVAVDLSLATVQVVNPNLSLNLQSATTLENVIGTALNDTLIGNTLSNTFTARGGDDTLVGGAGDDTYLFDTDLSLGSDTINDSSGIDTLNFSLTTTQRVFVDLSLATAQVVNSGLTLTLSSNNSIENAIGGALSDILVGNSLANTLTGNSGDDVLASRAGNDILLGGLGKNILIGGDGADQLTGGTSEDMLLGARYIYENDFTALDSLLAEWTSASSFNDRVDHLLGILAGGLHNGFTLTRSTVKEDNASDSMVGSNAADWYLRNSLGTPAIFRDTITDSIANSVFTEIDTWF